MDNPKSYFRFSGVIFTIIALVQLSRIVFRWDVALNGIQVSYIFNWLGILLAGFLAFWAFSLVKKTS